MSKKPENHGSKANEAEEKVSRRYLLESASLGLACLSLGELWLKADAAPTEASGTIGNYGAYVAPAGKPAAKNLVSTDKWKLTEDNILGPFYRPSAPYRAKITPPLEPGKTLLVAGRVWGFDTRKPLTHAVIDVWQASSKGRYDNDDPSKPPKPGVFLNRARLITDENGSYEFESVLPGPYQIGPSMWRPSHIHYMVQHPGYKTLVTQLYFDGAAHNQTDQFIKQSLIVKFQDHQSNNGTYQVGTFDIVLAAAQPK